MVIKFEKQFVSEIHQVKLPLPHMKDHRIGSLFNQSLKYNQ